MEIIRSGLRSAVKVVGWKDKVTDEQYLKGNQHADA